MEPPLLPTTDYVLLASNIDNNNIKNIFLLNSTSKTIYKRIQHPIDDSNEVNVSYYPLIGSTYHGYPTYVFDKSPVEITPESTFIPFDIDQYLIKVVNHDVDESGTVCERKHYFLKDVFPTQFFTKEAKKKTKGKQAQATSASEFSDLEMVD